MGGRRLGVALVATWALASRGATAQVVRYEVSVLSPGAHLFHVKAEFPSDGKDTLYLALPAWSPGNYEIQNYARYVRHFSATGVSGQPLFWDRADKETWRVATGKQRHHGRIRLSRRYHRPFDRPAPRRLRPIPRHEPVPVSAGAARPSGRGAVRAAGRMAGDDGAQGIGKRTVHRRRLS